MDVLFTLAQTLRIKSCTCFALDMVVKKEEKKTNCEKQLLMDLWLDCFSLLPSVSSLICFSLFFSFLALRKSKYLVMLWFKSSD